MSSPIEDFYKGRNGGISGDGGYFFHLGRAQRAEAERAEQQKRTFRPPSETIKPFTIGSAMPPLGLPVPGMPRRVAHVSSSGSSARWKTNLLSAILCAIFCGLIFGSRSTTPAAWWVGGALAGLMLPAAVAAIWEMIKFLGNLLWFVVRAAFWIGLATGIIWLAVIALKHI
jgi:hypothetical protein